MSYEWIRENSTVSEKELLELPKKTLVDGEYQYIALFTDKTQSGIWTTHFAPEIYDEEHLLELRIFNADEELKIIRTQMGNEFIWRIATEDSFTQDEIKNITYYEEHYLDINSKVDPIVEGVNTRFT